MINKLGRNELDMTIIDWLRLQDYRLQASSMILPNQIHPGLGIGHEIEEVLMYMIRRKKRDGAFNTPEHWYNAYMYYNYCHFHFLNPAFEGIFRSINESIRKDIETKKLTKVAWAVTQGKLYHRLTGLPFKWVMTEQVCPMSRRMKKYFDNDYTNIVMRNYHPKDYYIKWDDDEDNDEDNNNVNDNNNVIINRNNNILSEE